MVPEIGEGLRQMSGVDALYAAVGLAAIRQVGDAKRFVCMAGGGAAGEIGHPSSLAVLALEPSTGRGDLGIGIPGSGRRFSRPRFTP